MSLDEAARDLARLRDMLAHAEIALSHIADHFPDIRQQQLGQGMCLLNMFQCFTRYQVGGNFQVECQGREMVSHQVVQLPRNTYALGNAGIFRQQ